MKSVLERVSMLLLVISGVARAGDRWCGDTDCLCPQASLGWMLYVDSNHGAPDFWWTDSVTVREIFVCRHGVQFLFVTRQRGAWHHTALVLLKPTRDLLAHRLRLEPGSDMLESEFDHFRKRFEALTGSLEEISGGALVEGARIQFQEGSSNPPPVIVPNTRLELHWRERTLKLRGYLDVYFSLVV